MRRPSAAAVAASAYLVALTALFVGNYVLAPPMPSWLSGDLFNVIVNVVVPGVAGLVIRRAWALTLPVGSLVIGFALTPFERSDLPGEPLPPVFAALFIALPLGLAAVAVGALLGYGLSGRGALSRLRPSRQAHR